MENFETTVKHTAFLREREREKGKGGVKERERKEGKKGTLSKATLYY